MILLRNEGSLGRHKLTGEFVMVLKVLPDEAPPGYTVRRASDYGVMNVAHFEIDFTVEEEMTNGNNNNGNGPEGN